MPPKKLYRTCVLAGLTAAALLTAACSSAQQSQASIKQQAHLKWDLAKIGVQYQLAQQQYEVGDYDKCRQTLKDAMSANVPHAGLQMLSGKVDIEKGDLESAANHLKESIHINPADPEPYYLLGVVYQRWSKIDEAADYYEQAWDHKATEPRYMLAVVEMQITQGQLDEAQKLLESKIDYFEQSAALRIALARIAALKGNFLGASRYYGEAYLLLPDDPGVKRSYAESLYFAGKYANAALLLEEIRSHPQPQDGEEAQQVDSDRTTLLLTLGESYLNLQRPLDARTCFQEVIQTHASDLSALLGLGKVCVETNELGAAMSAAKKILHAEPQNVQAMILEAMVQEKQKQWPEAIATLHSANLLAPNDSTVLCMEGIALQKLGRDPEALPYFEKAAAANPNNHWASDLLNRSRPVSLKTPPESANAPDGPSVPPSVTNANPSGSVDGDAR